MGNHFGTQIGEARHAGAQQRLCEAIAERGSATTAELVAATGLHENTVRTHLEKLYTAGKLRRRPLSSGARGRPAHRWSIVGKKSQSPYLGLAVTLAETLASVGAAAPRLAREAGRAWGEELADGHPDAGGARQLVAEVMREQGFTPEDSGESISLHSCPLLAAATGHPEVVCATHAGMIEGIARAYDPAARVELQPFATASTCVLRLRLAS